jgi:hypothetical protein
MDGCGISQRGSGGAGSCGIPSLLTFAKLQIENRES